MTAAGSWTERAILRLRLVARDRLVLAAIALIAVVVITWLDRRTTADVGLGLFYVIPVAVLAWLSGRRLALLVALLGALTWMLADLLPPAQFDPGLQLWIGLTRLVVFASIAWLVASLREERDDLRAALDETARARARQATLLSSLRDPILVASRAGSITWSNEVAGAFFGPTSRIVGRQVAELLPFVTASPGESRWQGAVSDVSGRTVDVEATAAPMVGATEDRWTLYVVRDVSQHAQVMRLREQLLYDVAHELRGPLNILDGALEVLEADYADLSAKEFEKLTTYARRTAGRLRTLMEDLLSAGSIQAGRFTVRPRPVALASIVAEAIETVELNLAERGQRVDLAPGNSVIVAADPRYARQVLSNLLANASKYGPAGTPIRVMTERQGREVKVSVADDGPGIPAEQQVGLFERYYRIRPGRDEPGIGLGLAIAKGIIDAHGGRIGLDSAEGRGTSVWFTLPLSEGSGP